MRKLSNRSIKHRTSNIKYSNIRLLCLNENPNRIMFDVEQLGTNEERSVSPLIDHRTPYTVHSVDCDVCTNIHVFGLRLPQINQIRVRILFTCQPVKRNISAWTNSYPSFLVQKLRSYLTGTNGVTEVIITDRENECGNAKLPTYWFATEHRHVSS